MNTTTYSCNPSPVGPTAPKVVSVLVFVMAIVTCIGNGIVCYGMATTRRLRTNINCLVACMSATDLLSAVLLQPMDAMYFFNYPRFPYSPTVTILWNGEFHALMTGSVFFLTAVMSERLIAVRYALRYHAIVTDRVVRGVILFGWFYTCLTFVAVSAAQDVPAYGQYSFMLDDGCYATLYGLNVALPVLLTSAMAVYLTRVALMHRRTIRKCAKVTPYNEDASSSETGRREAAAAGQTTTNKVHPTQDMAPEKVASWRTNGLGRLRTMRSELKSLRLVITMAVCLILSWLPFLFSTVNYRFEILAYSCLIDFLALLLGWMTYWTSWVNLLIYVAMNKDFRGIIKRFFRCDRKPSTRTAPSM